jgi:hypothetical protein
MDIVYEKDNKERVPFEHYCDVYRQKDPKEISARTGFPYDEEIQCFTVQFLGRTCQVTFPEFSVCSEHEETDYLPLREMNAAQILMIRYLIEGCAVPSTGKFLTYRDVPWGEVYYRQFDGRCKQRLAFSYGSRIDAFCSALEHMGARKINGGDAGYEIEVIPGFFVRFQIWEADEEFPPSSQILFSDNFVSAFHPEDLVVVCDVIIGTMKHC